MSETKRWWVNTGVYELNKMLVKFYSEAHGEAVPLKHFLENIPDFIDFEELETILRTEGVKTAVQEGVLFIKI